MQIVNGRKSYGDFIIGEDHQSPECRLLLFRDPIQKPSGICKIPGRTRIDTMAAADTFDVMDRDSADRLVLDIDRHRTGLVAFIALDAFGVVCSDLLAGGERHEAERGSQGAEIAVASSGKRDPEKHHHQKLAGQILVRLDFREDAHIRENCEAQEIQNPAGGKKQCHRQEHPSHNVQNTEFTFGQLLLFPDQGNRRIKDFRGKPVKKAYRGTLEPPAPKQRSDKNNSAYAQKEDQRRGDTGCAPCLNRRVIKRRIPVQKLKRSRCPRERHRVKYIS